MSDDKPKIGMLKKDKNGFLDEIEQSQFDSSDFSAVEVENANGTSFAIRYRNSPFYFTVSPDYKSLNLFYYYYTLLAPGFRDSDEMPNSSSGDDIGGVYEEFAMWLNHHLTPYLEDMDEPDLWAQIQSQSPVVSDGPVGSDDREPFTQPEQAQLRMAIKEFRQLVIDKFEHSEEHLSLIDDRLDYLSEQVGPLNRINWRSLAFSTLVSITIALSLNNEQGNKLFELFRQVFSNIVPMLPQ